MTRSLLFIAALLPVVAACSELVPEAADSPLAPAIQMSQSEAGAAAASVLTVSTTCLSFRKELDEINEQLSARGNVSELEQKQVELATIVADVCN